MFARWFQPRRACQSARRRHSVLPRPLVEVLEDRTLLSTFMVDRLTDTGQGSDLAGDLRYCISQAADGDSIQFGVQGVINLTHALPDLVHSISIDGPGADFLTVRRDTGGKYRIFTVDNVATVEISGLTVADGVVDGVVSDGRGAGILNLGTLTVSNSTFSRNVAAGGGGGAIFNEGTLTVNMSTFSGNAAENGGGGIWNWHHGTLTVSNSIFSNNSCSDAGGAGIDNEDGAGALTVNTSRFTGNHGNGRGSALRVLSGPLMLSNSTVSGNTNFGGNLDRGAIFLGGITATLSNCTVSGNTSSQGGTIDCHGTVTISNSTISGNTVGDTDSAGGIFNSGTLTVSNSTISGNTDNNAVSAGGIRNSGTLTVSNSTISGNTGGSASAAGGILNGASGNFDATVTLLNCTIANNTTSGTSRVGSQLLSGHAFPAGTGQATVEFRNTIISGDGTRPNLFASTGGSFISQGHNLSSDDGSGFLASLGDLTNTDPLLGPLQDNGGPTFTHALLPGSPAVDAGDNTGAPSTDQRGLSRIVGGTIDIGAFEVQIGAATRLVVSAPASVTAGSPFDITVTALDNYGHVAAGYTGTVTFSTTDPAAGVVLPADYTFTAADGGVHTFTDTGLGETTLVTPGDQTVTATDTANGTITGSATVTVAPGPAAPPGGAASKPLTPTVTTDNAPNWSVQQGVSNEQVLAAIVGSDEYFAQLPPRFWPFV